MRRPGRQTHHIERRSSKGPSVIDVDPTRFVQILSTSFTTRRVHERRWFCVDYRDNRTAGERLNPRMSISVVDSGIGFRRIVASGVRSSQGETRSSQPGLGLGLALARRLVGLHNGRLDVRSEGDGRGSEFVLEVPLTTTQFVPAPERRADHRRLDRRILIVDDNEDAANTTAMLVEDMGGDARAVYEVQGLD